MSTLRRYWVRDTYWVSDEFLQEGNPSHRVAMYKADDVARVVVKQSKQICYLVDTGHKWDGYTLDYEEAQRLLKELE